MRYCIQSCIVFFASIILSVTVATAEKDKTQIKNTDSANDSLSSGSLANDSIVSDPFESVNRVVFAFNNTLDQSLLSPVAIGYNAVTPKVVRMLIRNELDYIQSPVSILNSALQGDVDLTLHTLGRFFINTTFGGLGLLDAASGFGLKPHQEDFGQTLAVWGVPSGGYYVAPALGALTLRDFGGKMVDVALNPTSYLGDEAMYVIPTATSLGIVDFRASNAEFIESLKKSSPDYYATVRTIYIQKRNSDIKNATFKSDTNNRDTQQPEFINFDD